MDAATRRNLELDTHPSGDTRLHLARRAGFHHHADGRARCCGAGCIAPCVTTPRLRLRHQAHRRTDRHPACTSELREKLRAIGDLERILARVALRSARPRDLVHPARRSGRRPGFARDAGEALGHPVARTNCWNAWASTPISVRLLDAAIVERPPALQREGGAIADGYDAELDELRSCRRMPISTWSNWSSARRPPPASPPSRSATTACTAITSRFGKAQADKAPTHYTRRQTTKNAERYITEELKAFEDKVLSAKERALMRERALYEACWMR